MILILSEQNDLSTTQVIEWLESFKKEWIRINKEDIIKLEYIGDDIKFITNDISFRLSKVSSFWYRRGFFNIQIIKSTIVEIDDFLREEQKALIQFVYHKLQNIHHLDSINNINVNKLIVNSIARDLNMLTPVEYIFSNKKYLDLLKSNNYITKTISGNPTLVFKDYIINNYTSKFNLEDVENNSFFPSLIQNYVEKRYELRIFYFKGECYTMAMFSQNDQQTVIDFRKYNDIRPNRRIPFLLPLAIQNKIGMLMRKLNFDTGSIDMIVTPQMEYVFLEVNPVGQFGMTSFPCNYNLEKKIAEYLAYGN